MTSSQSEFMQMKHTFVPDYIDMDPFTVWTKNDLCPLILIKQYYMHISAWHKQTYLFSRTTIWAWLLYNIFDCFIRVYWHMQYYKLLVGHWRQLVTWACVLCIITTVCMLIRELNITGQINTLQLFQALIFCPFCHLNSYTHHQMKFHLYTI